MSIDVTTLNGYNAQDYENLQAQYTEQTGKTKDDFDRFANTIITEGMTFDDFDDPATEGVKESFADAGTNWKFTTRILRFSNLIGG